MGGHSLGFSPPTGRVRSRSGFVVGGELAALVGLGLDGRSASPSSSDAVSHLARLFDADPGCYLRRLPERQTFAWPPGAGLEPGPAPRAIVKRSGREAARERWYARLRGQPVRSPGRREFDNLAALAAAGLPVPRPLAWCEVPQRGGASLVAMELVPHRETLRQRLAHAPAAERRRLGRELLELVLGLHVRGWYHRDLYLEHVLVAETGTGGRRLVLIDLGRARRERAPRRRWFVKDVAALLHSTPAAVTERERLRFLARYLDGRGVHGRAARRAFARDVLAKRRRLAAHRPRFDARDDDGSGA